MKQATKCELKPKLRFPEFQDAGEWEEKSIDSVCKSFSGGTPSTSENEYYGGSVPFIRSAEINKDRTELFLTMNGLENSAAKLVKKGDVLVALYGANSGEVALSKIDGAINQAILCLKSECSNSFIYQFLFYKKDWLVATYIQGGQGNLSGEIVKSIQLSFPKLKEQQRIADCLSSIDELIIAQTQKIDTLKTHKKGLIQQLFPAEGATLPKLRFPEFRDAGDWEDYYGNEIFNQISNKLHDSSFPVLAITQEHGAIPRDVINYQVSVTEKSIESYKVVEVGDFIISLRSFQGGIEYSQYKGICSPAYVILRKKTGGSGLYFKQFFKTERFIQQLNKNLEGLRDGKMVSYKQFSQLLLPITSIAEQQKIADCLYSLDELIKAQTQKLDTLKTHKKGLMQQLFPSLDKVQG